MYNLFAGDILPLDVIIRVPETPDFMRVVREFDLAEDGKMPIQSNKFQYMRAQLFADSEFQEPTQKLLDLTGGVKPDFSPGGSSATTVITAAKLGVGAQFLGIAGHDRLGTMVRNSFHEAGVVLLPENLPAVATPKSSTSFCFVNTDKEGKERTSYAVFRGNARDLITPDTVTTNIIAKSDGVFWQYSMLEKFPPEVSHYGILSQRWMQGKALFLAPHTNETVARHEDTQKHMGYILPSADVLLGSVKEWSWTLFPKVENKNINAEHVLGKIQTIVGGGFLVESGHAAFGEPTAYISHGAEGAFVVTPKQIEHVPAGPLERFFSAGGGGDTLAAGCIAGHVAGIPDRQDILRIGVELAAAKIETTVGPRLEDPLRELIRRDPALAEKFVSHMLRQHPDARFYRRNITKADQLIFT
ncbi:MAG: carbohydrate kinase family protein [Bdellovibrionales bacterium]